MQLFLYLSQFLRYLRSKCNIGILDFSPWSFAQKGIQIVWKHSETDRIWTSQEVWRQWNYRYSHNRDLCRLAIEILLRRYSLVSFSTAEKYFESSLYDEKSQQELCKDLTTLVQQSKHDANQFLMHALEIRQKLMLASQETDAAVTYDPVLVQKPFWHSVETGLASQEIRFRIRSVLEKPNVTDKELIQAMKVAVSNEAERSNEPSAAKSTKVNSVQDSANEVSDYTSSKNKVSDHKSKSEQASTAKLLEAIESLNRCQQLKTRS